jgi:hypothetical protein
VPVHAEVAPAIRERQRDFAESDGLAAVGPVENNVSHFAAAQGLGGLFAEHPANRVEHVRFAAAVRPDDRGDSLMEFEDGFVGERFESDEFERMEMHGQKAGDTGHSIRSQSKGGDKENIQVAAGGTAPEHKIWGFGLLAPCLGRFCWLSRSQPP